MDIEIKQHETLPHTQMLFQKGKHIANIEHYLRVIQDSRGGTFREAYKISSPDELFTPRTTDTKHKAIHFAQFLHLAGQLNS